MVNPVIRNDPEEDAKRVLEQKRKAPPKDFNEALEQVDSRNGQPPEEGLDSEPKGSKKTFKASSKTREDSALPLMSPFALASRGAKKSGDEELEENPALTSLPNISDTPKLKDSLPVLDDKIVQKKFAAFEAIEQHDLDGINPQGYLQTPVSPIATQLEPLENKIAVPLPRPVHEIMNEIVRQIDLIKLDGKTEITIDLKGTFNNSHLIITQFDSDKSSMNITIDNLTAANQQLLDAHKNALIKNLDDINIHVHIFTASSTIELNPTSSAKSEYGQSTNKERNPRDGRKQNQQQTG